MAENRSFIREIKKLGQARATGATRLIALVLAVSLSIPVIAEAQSALKKVRLALPTKTVSFLAFYVAYRKGFYKDEGIELEPIIMQPSLASTAVLTGDLDYNGAVTGVIGAAVSGRPMKAVLFTVARPLQYLMSRNDIKDVRDLKGRKIAGSSPGGTVTFLTKLVLKNVGLDSERDVFLNPMGGTGASRLAALESGVVDAVILESPDNVLAQRKGFRELIFFGDQVEFPQNGFGTSEKKLKETPDEVFRMVRATLRGLAFSWDKRNYDQVIDIIMREMKPISAQLANESFEQVMRVITKDGSVKTESIQVLIDLVRENTKVTRPVTVNQVVDFTFLERAQKELGLR
ncbi:MAG: nitrate transporter substrate-binding protein [Deltaproteobacteria bacterium]|nr:nitrate transporter substrate-binding protein [Deltaproteobacteria bacterium]